MSTRGTKCLFCRQRYVQAGAYETHHQSRHAELYDGLFNKSARDVSRDPSPSTNSYEHPAEEWPDVTFFARMNQSDYESDHYESDDYEEHASDGDENPAHTSSNTIGRIDAHGNAGRRLMDVDPNLRFEKGLLEDPWRPFCTLDDFKLTNWFITSKVSRSQIDEYFSGGLAASSLSYF